jgi:hypothetical protein
MKIRIDNGQNNSDWIKTNAFDFPGVKTLKQFYKIFNIPEKEPEKSIAMRRLATMNWVDVAPDEIRQELMKYAPGTPEPWESVSNYRLSRRLKEQDDKK